MLGRMMAGAAAGYMLTGDVGGALGGAAMGTAGIGIGRKFFGKKSLAGRLSSAVGQAAKAAPESMVKANMTTRFAGEKVSADLLKASVRRGMAARGVAPKNSFNVPLTGITPVKNTRNLGSMSFAQKDPGYLKNIRDTQNYLHQNRINVNKFGGAALGALGMYSASRMGSSLINSNRGY